MSQEKDIEYTIYVCEHVFNVKAVWSALQKYTKAEYWLDDATFFAVDGLIKQHDRSKLDRSEFEGYRQWFYPEGDFKTKSLFDVAWNHHQKNNPHHWQYWLMWKPEGTEALEMPFEYIIEMLCDWAAMSVKFKDTPSAFYQKEKDNMLLAPNTLSCIESWLPQVDYAVSDILNETTVNDAFPEGKK